MLPILAGLAAGGALKAGVGGLQNYIEGQDKEKEARKQALQALGNKFRGGDFTSAPSIPKGPNFAQSVVAPMATAALSDVIDKSVNGKPSAPTGQAAQAATQAPAAAAAPSYPQDPPTPDDPWYKDHAYNSLGGYFGGGR